jgi:hypothetical protein
MIREIPPYMQEMAARTAFEVLMGVNPELRSTIVMAIIHDTMTAEGVPTMMIDGVKNVPADVCPLFIYAAHGQDAEKLREQLTPAIEEMKQKGTSIIIGDEE